MVSILSTEQTVTAELGNLEARRQVAKLYRLGIGGEKNKKRETCIMKKQQLVVMQLRFIISKLMSGMQEGPESSEALDHPSQPWMKPFN
eukprot:scaffold25088_cov72-Skeletonema_dohrnii-CCMP3373.AAC.1